MQLVEIPRKSAKPNAETVSTIEQNGAPKGTVLYVLALHEGGFFMSLAESRAEINRKALSNEAPASLAFILENGPVLKILEKALSGLDQYRQPNGLLRGCSREQVIAALEKAQKSIGNEGATLEPRKVSMCAAGFLDAEITRIRMAESVSAFKPEDWTVPEVTEKPKLRTSMTGDEIAQAKALITEQALTLKATAEHIGVTIKALRDNASPEWLTAKRIKAAELKADRLAQQKAEAKAAKMAERLARAEGRVRDRAGCKAERIKRREAAKGQAAEERRNQAEQIAKDRADRKAAQEAEREKRKESRVKAWRRFRPEYIEQARKMARAGKTDKQIYKRFGVSVQTFIKWKKNIPGLAEALDQAGRPKHRAGKTPTKCTPAQVEKAAKLYRAGCTLEEIAGHFGVSYCTFNRWRGRVPALDRVIRLVQVERERKASASIVRPVFTPPAKQPEAFRHASAY